MCETVGKALRLSASTQRAAGWIAGYRQAPDSSGRMCMLGAIDRAPIHFYLRMEVTRFLADYLRPRLGDGVLDTYNHTTADKESAPSTVIAAFSNMLVPKVVGSDDSKECGEKAATIFENAADAWDAQQGV